jgi:hypothetical protein
MSLFINSGIENFEEETRREIKNVGLTPEMVAFVTDGENSQSFDDFISNCNFEYNSSFGRAYINSNLEIVFNDGSWLERGEYDGSEWWQYKKTSAKPKGVSKLKIMED